MRSLQLVVALVVSLFALTASAQDSECTFLSSSQALHEEVVAHLSAEGVEVHSTQFSLVDGEIMVNLLGPDHPALSALGTSTDVSLGGTSTAEMNTDGDREIYVRTTLRELILYHTNYELVLIDGVPPLVCRVDATAGSSEQATEKVRWIVSEPGMAGDDEEK